MRELYSENVALFLPFFYLSEKSGREREKDRRAEPVDFFFTYEEIYFQQSAVAYFKQDGTALSELMSFNYIYFIFS